MREITYYYPHDYIDRSFPTLVGLGTVTPKGTLTEYAVSVMLTLFRGFQLVVINSESSNQGPPEELGSTVTNDIICKLLNLSILLLNAGPTKARAYSKPDRPDRARDLLIFSFGKNIR